MRRLINLLLIILIISCKGKVKNNQSINNTYRKQAEPIGTTKKINTATDSLLYKNKVRYSFVVLKNSYNEKQKISIYNLNGSVWKSFNFNDFFNDKEINPFALKPENKLLIFKCLKNANGYFFALVDEDKNIIKYIKNSDINFEIKSVTEHILSVFSVEFDDGLNPLHIKAEENSEIFPIDKNSFYYPIKIRGNWLLVEDDNKRTFG